MTQSNKQQNSMKRPSGIPQSLPLELIPPAFNDVLKQVLSAYEIGDLVTASDICAQIVRAQPDHILALEYMGLIARDLNNPEAAIQFFEGIHALAPRYGRALARIAGVHIHMQDIDKAKPYLDKAMALDSEDSHTHTTYALYYDLKGDKDQGKAHYKKAHELDPDNHLIFFKYLDNAYTIKHIKDKNLRRLHALEGKVDTLPPATRQALYSCLYKAYERMKDFDKAFLYMKNSADDKREGLSYDIETTIRKVSYLREFFTKDYVEGQKKAKGCVSDLPVFVLGMPRSGTTLIEQILHSHRDVFGIGEDLYLEAQASEFNCLDEHGAFQPYTLHQNPEAKTLSKEAFGQKYVDYLKICSPTAKHIINKAMSSHFWIGEILLSMPNAKIIYCRRNPLDCCLSCYSYNFREGSQSFSYNLTELGLSYRLHSELMQFWMALFPDNIVEVVYEDVVNDLEGESKRLVDFLDLPWDTACLEFYKTEKTVMTASKDQVRKPLYSSSIDRWKNYALHLQPLIEALGPFAPKDSLYILDQDKE